MPRNYEEFRLRILTELHEERKERKRTLHVLRVRRYRVRLKQRIRIARLQERRTKLAAQIAVLQARIDTKEYHRRRCAKAHDGMIAGYSAAAPLTEAQLQELHFSKRYKAAYLEAVAQRQQWVAKMAKQNSPTPVVQPRTIQL